MTAEEYIKLIRPILEIEISNLRLQAREEALNEALAWIEANMYDKEHWEGPVADYESSTFEMSFARRIDYGSFNFINFKAAFAAAMWRPEQEAN